MKPKIANDYGTQSALHAMEAYFSAHGSPDRLRVNDSGDIEIAGRFTLLFDRIADRVKALVTAGYQPVRWQEKAREAVLGKLDHSLSTLLPSDASAHRTRTENLLGRIGHHLDRSQHLSWKQALAIEMESLHSSDAGAAMSNALRLLVDISQIGNPEIERQAIASIGAQPIDFALLSESGRQAMLSGLSKAIASHLQTSYSLDTQASLFGAEAVLYAIQSYRLDLNGAMKLLGLPTSLRGVGAEVQKGKLKQFVRQGIARTIRRHTGVSAELANKGAKSVEFCMCRYGLDWKQALDLAGLASRITPQLRLLHSEVQADTTPAPAGKMQLSTEEMDEARAVQQVMARDRCNANTAIHVVQRRIKALDLIRTSLPPHARPSVVGGMKFHISSPIAESSKRFLADQIRSLKTELKRDSWAVPETGKTIKIARQYLVDSVRSLRVALDDGKQQHYFDKENAAGLTSAIHTFADDAETMTALCDSLNQTILGSILKIIFQREQQLINDEPLRIGPGEDLPGINSQRLWHSATLDGKGNLVIRHVFIQKIGMIMNRPPDEPWPINKGDAWHGDVNPLNAGLTCDFSYAFSLSELKQGIRNPQIRECHYTIAGSLDWDTIESTLS